MQWLLDSDVIWKLATFDLLDELLGVLDAQKAEIFCLPELQFQLKGTRIFSKHSREVIQRTLQFVKGTKQISKIDPAEQAILQSAQAMYLNRIERIDGGEQLLFMATKTLRASIISTHDKKALRTLANDTSCRHIYERAKGRVLCLEQLILRMIEKFGYGQVQSKIAPNCSIDHVMQDAFANGRADFPEDECRKWLDDYIRRLRSEARDILVQS